MKKLALTILLLLAFFPQLQAQKYACVNTDYIMRQMPEYNQVLNKLNKYITEWKGELDGKQQEVDELRERYQQEAYLLPDNLKQRRQDEINSKETELRNLQRQRFSAGGDLDQKRAELLKPVQDRVYNAIERIAREKSYAFVFDKAASNTVLYVGEKYDISNQVLEMLGIKPGSNTESATSSPGSNSANKGASSSSGSNSNAGRNNSKKEIR